ncbi:type IV pilus modification protein PilV [Agitococcus lubricus]|uniref:Type IV pilus assembly protein PilV n=1 Tax=Agitococcus lubricus TaxID=1077255 RepID=A0A2T5J2D5_9GAMM|nr:type IV pilus modification protein PilV [Agitococcus lubricus]PTQ90680.1 type IV pilus assembly protein PilV [Agitococcus lubricus]
MKKMRSLSRQRGVGMPEILVALLLLGITVMGFAALQIRSLGTTNEAMYRSQAMALAQDLAEKVMANQQGVATYNAAWNPLAVAANLCETNNCTPAQMAQYDIRNAVEVAARTLPNGRIGMAACPLANNRCLYVAWNDTTPTVGNGVNDCSLTTGLYRLGADCVMLEIY